MHCENTVSTKCEYGVLEITSDTKVSSHESKTSDLTRPYHFDNLWTSWNQTTYSDLKVNPSKVANPGFVTIYSASLRLSHFYKSCKFASCAWCQNWIKKIATLGSIMFGTFGSVWCKTALAEVGVSLP